MQQAKQEEIAYTHSLKTQLQQALCGGVAGCITRFVTQPFDMLKIRFQMQVEPVRRGAKDISKYTSMLQGFKTVYAEEGVTGLWRGHNAGQLLSILYALMQFWSYEQLKQYSKKYNLFNNNKALMHFLCGGMAGCLGVIVSQPFDTIRTRIIASDKNSKLYNMSSFRGAKEILRTEGVLPLLRGTTISAVQVFPLVGSNFLFYNYLNALALPTCSDEQIPGYILFVNGGIAGTAAKAVVYPLDLIKKRIQLNYFRSQRTTYGQDASCRNIFHCISQTYKREGIHGFYKGMAPTLWKSGVTTAVYFGVYDNLRRYSQEKKKQNEAEKTNYEIN